MKYVMRNAGMVANSVKVKNASYPSQSLTKPLIVPGNISPQIHDARSKGIMCHLVLSRRHLLHHEQSQSHKTETITEVLEHDGTAYQQFAFRLVHGKQGIRHKGQIEDAAQREQRPPQSPVRNVIACQQ